MLDGVALASSSPCAPRRRVPRWLVGPFVMVAYIMAMCPAPAQALVADADYWKRTQTHRDTVYRLAYSQSPQAVPSTYDPVREAEEILRRNQRAIPPSNSQSASLWQRARTLNVRAALSTPLRALTTIGLAAGTFELGWKIGSGINAKFLHLGTPEPPPTSVGHAPAFELRFQPQQWVLYSTTSAGNNRSSWYPAWIAPDVHARCDPYGLLSIPQAPLREEVSATPGSTCRMPDGQSVFSNRVRYVVPENELFATGPIEDYTNQSYARSSTAPNPPPRTTVEQTITTELDKPENALLRNWLNYELGSPSQTDPLGLGPTNSEIEFFEWVFKWGEHGHEFEPEYDDPEEYRRAAQDIVERKRNDNDPSILRCDREGLDGEPDAELFWDIQKQAIVVVKDGKIITFYRPTGGFDHWVSQCTGAPLET